MRTNIKNSTCPFNKALVAIEVYNYHQLIPLYNKASFAFGQNEHHKNTNAPVMKERTRIPHIERESERER